MSKISVLINAAKNEDSSVDANISFSHIYNAIAQKINAQTGIDCKGAEVIITAYDIAHIFKRHGNDKEEKLRGQLGIVEKDFDLIKEIIFNYDNVEKGKDVRGSKSLVFTKRIGNEFKLIVKVEGKIPYRKMVVKTMFKKP